MSDEIRLTLPRESDFYGVAHLVIGGLAVRLNLTYEELEDIELALENLLEHDEGVGEITVAVRLHDGALTALVGPFDAGAIRAELGEGAPEELGLRRILDTVADEVTLAERDGGQWVEVRKRINPAPRAGS